MSTELLDAMAALLDRLDYRDQPTIWTVADLRAKLEREGVAATPGQFKAALASLEDGGHVIIGTCMDLGVQQRYGTPPNTRLVVTVQGLAATKAAQSLRMRNSKRGNLMAQAREAVLERHQQELVNTYASLCAQELLGTDDEPDTWVGSL